MVSARDFYQGLAQAINNRLDSVRPWRASVTGMSDLGEYLVTPSGSDEEMLEPIGRIKGFDQTINFPTPDDVVVLPMGGSHIILGKIEDGSLSPESYSFPISFLQGALIYATDLSRFSPDGAGGFEFADGGGSSALTIVPSTGAITAKNITATSFNSPIFFTEAQSSSDAASTTSTTNYSTAITATYVLPTGTWSVAAQGGVALTHSAGGNVNMQVNIDGDLGTARALSASATVSQMMISEHAIGGRTGTIDVVVRFKSSAAGTTAARNPWLIMMARRTA